MPNGHGSKEYGPHKYADHDGTSDCEYGCGCWAGSTNSGGPLGLDPLGGKCPGNPTDGKFLKDQPLAGKNADYEKVVKQRINELERRAYAAEEKLKAVTPSKAKLAEQLRTARTKAAQLECDLLNMARAMEPYLARVRQQ